MTRPTDAQASLSRARSEAGKRGAQAVKATFGAVITRRRFAELIGVSTSTIKRWEQVGVVRPRMEVILKSPTAVFEPSDVEFGRLLIAVLRGRPGQDTIQEAAQIVREGSGR